MLPADVIADGGGWRAAAVLEGQIAPNTRLRFRFRARAADHIVLGPESETTVVDDRFEWRTISGPIVRLHWYEGDEAFAQRALDIGEEAIATAGELLGVTENEPIDFFIYATEPDLRAALNPNRENIAGQAHSNIRTLFGLIGSNDVDSEWVDTLVRHELTHLVFDAATDNPYHSPPRWLNEGVAVYLSEGNTPSWQASVAAAVADDSLIPLDGLAGLFPTAGDRLELAYGESVSAVDFFIRSYDEPTLWQLVRSYADGVSDDDAFRAATGAGVAEFNAAWMASLGADVPEPAGPRPGQPGPLPPGWTEGGAPAATPGAPGATTLPGTSPRPGETTRPGETPDTRPGTTPAPTSDEPGSRDTSGHGAIGLLLAVLVVAAIVVLAVLAQRRRSPPAGGPPPVGSEPR